MGKAESANRFECAVRALAQEGDVQRALFPSFVCPGDEMALEFDERLRTAPREELGSTQEQTAAIERLDSLIANAVGLEETNLWFGLRKVGEE